MHYYERTISDIKAEYTEFLIYILSPLIYEGIKSMYNKSIEQEQKYIQMSKDNINVKNPGVFKIFQHFLKNIQTLNQNIIESEMIRIRDASKHADIFEKLIKAVIKSNIILLTYNASGQQCKIINEKLHEKIDCKTFIHKVYIESAKQFYNAPELFWHNLPPIEIKKNQRECISIINKAINIAIKESMPMTLILEEYLRNDYVVETENDKINRIKDMVNNNAEDRINYFDEGEQKILVSEEENNIQNDIQNDIQNNINDIEELIQGDEIKNSVKLESINESINEEEYKERLNKLNQNQLNGNRNKSNRNQLNEPKLNENLLNTEKSDENINIVQNKVDDRTYLNAFFN
jgi:hypothetical protein